VAGCRTVCSVIPAGTAIMASMATTIREAVRCDTEIPGDVVAMEAAFLSMEYLGKGPFVPGLPAERSVREPRAQFTLSRDEAE
jgi:hypothetical protein